MRKRTIIKGTIILTIAGFITRIMGFVNRIYLSRVIGAEGIGLYQLVFPVYMICYTLCCSGLFTAISKLVASENAKGNRGNVRKVLKVTSSMSLCISLLLTAILYLKADWLSVNIIKEPRIAMGLKIASLSIPFTALAQIVKGYFYGVNKTTMPAITQVSEQIIRIAAIYFLSSYFVPKGIEYACLVAVIGMVIGEITSGLLIGLSYLAEQWQYKANKNQKPTNTYAFFIGKVTSIAFPLTLNRVITQILSSFETILIPSQLKLFGYSHNYAISIYGSLSGMAFPLIYFPTVVTSSAALVLLPAISEAYSKNQRGLITKTVSLTIKFSLLIGILFAFYFLAFGKDLGMAVYGDEYVGDLLIALSLLCPFLYLQTTMGSLLNGMDLHLITFRNSIVGLVTRILFVYLLIPKKGMPGYMIGLIVSLIIVTVMDISHMVKKASIHFNVFSFVLLPSFCCVGALAILKIINHFYTFDYGIQINTCINSSIYFLIMTILAFTTRCVNIKDFKA